MLVLLSTVLFVRRYEQLANNKLDLPEMVMEQHRK
jgi:hypothetical protein